MMTLATQPFFRATTKQPLRSYCASNSEKNRFKNTFDTLKKNSGSITAIVSEKVENAKHGINNLTEEVVVRSKNVAQGAKLALDETKGKFEDVNLAIMESKNAIVETANSARKMFKVAALVVIICGSLFALGLAAESIAKIFESYDRIKKVMNNSKSDQSIE